jgi:hypothetical protein
LKRKRECNWEEDKRTLRKRDNLKLNIGGHQWLMPVILATQEAEIRRIMI